MSKERRFELGRRGFLGAAGSLAAVSLLGGTDCAGLCAGNGLR